MFLHGCLRALAVLGQLPGHRNDLMVTHDLREHTPASHKLTRVRMPIVCAVDGVCGGGELLRASPPRMIDWS